jgi:hypothetical protein
MHSPADIIYQLLLDLNLGTEDGDWKMFVGFLPDLSPTQASDNAIAVYDTAGKFDGRLMYSGHQVEHPGVQIRVVGPVYPDTWEKVNAIALALDGVGKVSVAVSSEEAYVVANVSRSGSIIPMGMEEEGDRRRHNFTINAMLTLSPSP